MSSGEQLKETIKLYFGNYKKIIVIKIVEDSILSQLVWEVSRNNSTFPHYYGVLELSYVDDFLRVDVEKVDEYSFN